MTAPSNALYMAINLTAVKVLPLALLLLAILAGILGLRRSRRPDEKRDFTLILAYWQTLRDAQNHPDDTNPRQNPAFQPARNALNVVKHLIPAILLLLSALLIFAYSL